MNLRVLPLVISIFVLGFQNLQATTRNSRHMGEAHAVASIFERYARDNAGELPDSWGEWWDCVLADYPAPVDKNGMREVFGSRIGGDPAELYQLLTNTKILDPVRGQMLFVTKNKILDDRFDQPIRYVGWFNEEVARSSYLRENEIVNLFKKNKIGLETTGTKVVKFTSLSDVAIKWISDVRPWLGVLGFIIVAPSVLRWLRNMR